MTTLSLPQTWLRSLLRTLRIRATKLFPEKKTGRKNVLNLEVRAMPPHQTYIPEVESYGWIWNLTQIYRPPSPNFFRGVKSAKFGLNFRPLSTSRRSGFETQQHNWNLRGAQMMVLNPPQIRCRSFPNSEKWGYNIALLNMRPWKLVNDQ